MQRVSFALTVSLTLSLAACGGSPTSPSTSPLPPPTAVLVPGAYALTIAQGAAPAVIPGGTTFTTIVCLSAGLGPPTSVALDVQLVTEGGSWRGSAGQLSFVLSPSGVGIAGPATGRATTAAGVGIALGDENGPAVLAGVVKIGGQVEGTIGGHVQLSSGTSNSSCNQNSFRLTRR